MIDELFAKVEPAAIHSVTLGPMRFPKAMFERIVKLYPSDPLFALQEMLPHSGQVTYSKDLESEMIETVCDALRKHLPESRIFRQV